MSEMMDSQPEALSYEALVRLNKKLLLATKITGIGVWEYCLETKRFVVDEVLLSLYGVTTLDKELDVDVWLSYVHENDRERAYKVFEEITSTYAEGKIEFRVVWPDGSVHILQAILDVERDKNGNPLRILGTNRDITVYKKAEEAIRESEAKYRSFFENSMDGLLLTQTDGQILAANPAACEIFQMTEAEICETGRMGLVDTGDPRTAILLRERQLKGKAKGEITYRRKDGSPFPGELTTVSFVDGCGNKRTSMIIRDITERKHAEYKLIAYSNALQQAVNDLNRIMDSSLDIICTIDKKGRFVNVSSASTSILGYQPSELIGKKYIDLVWHEDVKHTSKVAASIMNGVPVTMFENQNVRKDGSIVPLLWSARWSVEDKLMYCVAKDATEKKQLEKAFESERQRFHDLFLDAPSGLGFLKGPNHVFEMVNDQYLQLVGRKDLIGKTVREAFPEEEVQHLISILDTVYSTGKPYVAKEYLIQLNDEVINQQRNVYFNFVYQAYRNKNNEIEGVFVFILDVTEQVQAREKISKRNADLQAILSNTDIGYILLSRGLKIIAFNPNANQWMANLHTQPLQEGCNYLNYFNALQVEEVKRLAGSVLDGKSVEYETNSWGLDGKHHWYCVKMHPILTEDGKVSGICIATEDVTAAKEAEIEKENMTSALIQRNKDLEQFNYIVSHNIRSHVANIAGICGVLNEEPRSSDVYDTFWEQLYTSVDHLDAVLKDLNRVLQIKKGVTECAEEVDFSKLVQDIKESISCQIELSGAIITTDFSEIETMKSIKTYLYSIFYNLITNSIKYSKPGEPPVVSIISKKEDGRTKLIFRDKGLGIDLEKNGHKLFGLYKRFHDHVAGKGMGLFMTKTHVESLGGTISVASQINEGCEFTIIL